ncbi:MAG: hypothetical protein IIB17_11085 [Chloroflexi bacterium]|nr:hypothetical protein [Chloroflexota bacterium]
MSLRGRRFLVHGIVGLALIGVSWPMSWLHVEPFGRHSFFSLWLGYILVVDAIVLRRRGESLLTRSPAGFVLMFVASAPLWWAFEGINQLTDNWRYIGVSQYSALQYALLATWNFSIVIPAVFETAELLGSFNVIRRFHHGPKIPLSGPTLVGIALLGVVMMPALALWPKYVFPMAWLSLFLVLDTLNLALGRPSIASDLRRGDWRQVAALALGALVCGWFWEMWNFRALPKWEYSIPYLGFARVFEMPVLGYLGYLPFGLEVYAGYHFLTGWFNRVGTTNVPVIEQPSDDRVARTR